VEHLVRRPRRHKASRHLGRYPEPGEFVGRVTEPGGGDDRRQRLADRARLVVV
jgi:hypothetical protein